MWGKYEDVLVSELEGLPPAQLPISLGVTGLPIRLGLGLGLRVRVQVIVQVRVQG